LNERQNFGLEKFFEVISCYAGVNIVVYCDGYAHSVARSKTKTSRKHYFAFEMSLFDFAAKKIDYLLRTFEMTGTANANPNYYHII